MLVLLITELACNFSARLLAVIAHENSGWEYLFLLYFSGQHPSPTIIPPTIHSWPCRPIECHNKNRLYLYPFRGIVRLLHSYHAHSRPAHAKLRKKPVSVMASPPHQRLSVCHYCSRSYSLPSQSQYAWILYGLFSHLPIICHLLGVSICWDDNVGSPWNVPD